MRATGAVQNNNMKQLLEDAVTATANGAKPFQVETWKGTARVTKGALGVFTITASLDGEPELDTITIKVDNKGQISDGVTSVNLPAMSGGITTRSAQPFAKGILSSLSPPQNQPSKPKN